MFDETNPKFKVVIHVEIIPDGMPVPEIPKTKSPTVAQLSMDCLANKIGVAFGEIGIAVPMQHACITAVAAKALSIAGDTLAEVATGKSPHINSEEIREYDQNGNLISSNPVISRTLN
ncbi:hypothetical protein NLN93_20395 [Citrobacter portucalensis]|nr:hypothetical protein [Citrobacter portucalensis]